MDDAAMNGAPGAPADPGAGLVMAEYGSILNSASQLLDDVERALTRLDQGTYHSCVVCGAPVGAERHARQPLTDRCDDHGPSQEGP
jgi:RNA polymerase-binding transcription factor DksA